MNEPAKAPVLVVGSFDAAGCPVGWLFDCHGGPAPEPNHWVKSADDLIAGYTIGELHEISEDACL